MGNDRFNFHFSPQVHKRLCRSIAGSFFESPRASLLMIVIWVAQLVGVLLIRPYHQYSFMMMSLAVFGIVLYGVQYFKRRDGHLAVEGSLQLGEAGFAGTLEGKPAAIDWSDIDSVRNIDDAIIFFRRRAAGEVAIPKASIADATAFWEALEDRLVSKRGLIRSPTPRKTIANTAY